MIAARIRGLLAFRRHTGARARRFIVVRMWFNDWCRRFFFTAQALPKEKLIQVTENFDASPDANAG
jgi:hypothetical protein